jgi:hypothetical protein
MLQNDVSGMAALDEPIKASEKDLDGLKIGMGEVMGAGIHGKSGNQLLGGTDDTLRSPGHGRPQFAASDMAAHVTGLDDKADSFFGHKPEDYKEPSDSLFGKRPQDYEGKKGVVNSGGGYADFFRNQREGERPILTTGPDPSDPTSDFWDKHVKPEPFNPNDPNLKNAPLRPGAPGTETIPTTYPDVTDPTSNFWDTHVRPVPFNPNDPNLKDAPLKLGVKEPDYTRYVVESGDMNSGMSSGGGYADFFRNQREGERPIPTTGPDVSDPTSDFWDTHVKPEPFNPNDPNLKNAPLRPGAPGTETIPTTYPDASDPTSNFWDTHVRPEPFDPNDPNLKNAPLKPGMKEPDYTQYVVESRDTDTVGKRSGVTNSDGGYADFFRDQREQYGNVYKILNSNGKTVDNSIVEDAIDLALSKTGEVGKGLKRAWDQGYMEVFVGDYNESNLSQKGALDLYYAEQDGRNEIVKDIISIIEGAEDPVKMLSWLAAEVTKGTSFQEGVSESILSGKRDIKSVIKGGALSELKDKSIDLVLNTIDLMKDDITKIEEGNYVTTTVKFIPLPSASYNTRPIETYVRLIYKNGGYIYDPDNPLCQITPGVV